MLDVKSIRFFGRAEHDRGPSSRLSPKLLLGGSAIPLVLPVVAWRALPDGRLHVFYLINIHWHETPDRGCIA